MGPAEAGEALQAARGAFDRRAWAEAYRSFAEVGDAVGLGPDDLEKMAHTAYLTGREDEYISALERAHQSYLDRGDELPASRCAMWLGMMLFARGEVGPGTGWLQRARRLVEDRPDSVEHGYLLVATGRFTLEQGEVQAAREAFERAAAIAGSSGDRDLAALARLGLGNSYIFDGAVSEGLALLDEAMVSLQADEVTPIPAGIIYCAVIGVCQSIHDLRRAREWVNALSAWCDAQPDLVPFRGQCLVHRSEILQLQGAWTDALESARRARERLSDPPGDPALASAYYQEGELHRLRGDLERAEHAYRRAGEIGLSPQPGLALLRLAQGRVGSAEAALSRAIEEERDPSTRARLLAALVEVLLALTDVERARRATEDLEDVARALDVPFVRALHAHAVGAVTLAAGDARGALPSLRKAHNGWRDLDAPYEAARARVLIGLACAELGDDDGATMELGAARQVFTQLGARPDLETIDSGERTANPGGLSDREVEVLQLVAAGDSNREIARRLVISEHTVARHVQNIFGKIDVSSRTAAAAFAFEQGLFPVGDRSRTGS